jgi:hypothetical protein
MHAGEWLPGTPERKQRARGALASTLTQWTANGPASLPSVRPARGDPAAERWAEILTGAVRAAEVVARFSEASRRPAPYSEPLAGSACEAIAELARCVLELGGDLPVNRDALLGEAERFIDEVDDEDDGVMLAVDALSVLLQRSWPRARAPAQETASLVVGALAPLLAQDACVRTRIGAR